jgi:hypothetical protein
MIRKHIISELLGEFLSIPRKNIYNVGNVEYSYMTVYTLKIIMHTGWDPKDVHAVELSYLTGIINDI